MSTTDLSGNLVEGPVNFTVTIIDQNDNRPIFKEMRYTGEVLEGSPTGRALSSVILLDWSRSPVSPNWLNFEVLCDKKENLPHVNRC